MIGPTDTAIAIDIKAATDAQLQEALELIHKEQLIRAFSVASMEPRKQMEQEVVMALLEDQDSWLNQGLADALDAKELELEPSPPVASAFVEPLPLTEEAGYLEGMDRYLSPEWDIPTCPIIGKGPSDHCKHGMGNLDYCPHCEHENDDIDLSEEEI